MLQDNENRSQSNDAYTDSGTSPPPSAPEGSVYAEVFDALEAADATYAGATDKGGLYTCPVHADSTPSLAVDVGRKRPLFYCFPCCGDSDDPDRRQDFLAELRALGVPMREGDGSDVKWGAPAPTYGGSGGRSGGGGGVPVAVYTYNWSDGSPNFKAMRYEGEFEGRSMKRFVVSRWVGAEGRYVTGVEGVTRTPYQLEQFADWAEQGKTVYLVEGEKAADALLKLGVAATTFQGGTSAPMEAEWTDRFLGFAKVRIWPDADEIGVEWAKVRAAELKAAEITVEAFGVPTAGPSDDAADGVKGARVLKGADARRFIALKPKAAPKRPAAKKQIGSASRVASTEEQPYPVSVVAEPFVFAQEMLDRHFTDDSGTLLLRYHIDRMFWLWSTRDNHYRLLDGEELPAIIDRLLRGARETTGEDEPRPVRVKPKTVTDLSKGFQYRALVSEHGAGALLSTDGGVPFRNGLLDIQTGELLPIGPERDVRWVIPADYDPDAGKPEAFIDFLKSIGFGPETGEYRLLQQWFGYLLSGSKKHDKALLLLGPSRAGKGTVIRVASALLGDETGGATGTDLNSLTTNFGLQPLVGKALATIGDARFGRADKGLNARLLSLTSNDSLPVDVKYGKPVSLNLRARLMIATNEPPNFIEASDALARRFLILRFNESFMGREDPDLYARLTAELPQIARWALDGLADLNEARHFAETESGRAEQDEMMLNAAPVRRFVEEVCERGSDFSASKDDLFRAYDHWAQRRNYYRLNEAHFFRDLRTAFPGAFHDTRPRIGKERPRSLRGIRLNDGEG